MMASEPQIEAAVEMVADDICPIDQLPLEVEMSYDEIGWHGCKYCPMGHVWRLILSELDRPDPDSVAEGLENSSGIG